MEDAGIIKPGALLDTRRRYRALVIPTEDAMLIDALWLITPKGTTMMVDVLPGDVMASFDDGFKGLRDAFDKAERAELVCIAMMVRGTATTIMGTTTGYILRHPSHMHHRALKRRLVGDDTTRKRKKPRVWPHRQAERVQ